MEQGKTSSVNEELADFIINEAYPIEVIPLSCILGGSRAYGLDANGSDYDYLGIHLMDTWECLQHPTYRRDLQMIRKKFTADHKPVSENEPSSISLDSFEMWKFIDLLQKGSFAAYEILYMPEIHHAEGIEQIIMLSRACLTSKIGRSIQGMITQDWGKTQNSRKKTVMAYYRLAQALYLLKEGEFEWQAENLFHYIGSTTNLAATLLETYKHQEIRETNLPDDAIPSISHEIVHLMDEVNKAMLTTALPHEVPKDVLQNLLEVLKQTRARLI